MLAGNVVAGWQMARALLVAEEPAGRGTDPSSCAPRSRPPASMRDHILSKVPGLRHSIVEARRA